MASVRERHTKAGESTFSVLYRLNRKQSSRTFPTLADAEEFADRVDRWGAARALRWLHADDDPAAITVDDLARRFLVRKAGRVEPRTHDDYTRDYEKWIRPTFGEVFADDVTEADVQDWVDDIATKLAPKTVAGRHMLLHSIYEFGCARSRQLVQGNPCKETELPSAARKPPRGTTVAEWRAVLDVAAERNPAARDLILFLGTVGWRFSEATALAVDDVEVDGDRVFVNVTRVFRVIKNRQVLMPDTAKTYAGFRRVEVLSAEARAMLRRRLEGRGRGEHVFTNSHGNHWNQQTFLRDTWPALTKAAGIVTATRKPTPHWLRHMAVGVLAGAGVPITEIRRYLGHANLTTTTSTYGGMIGGVDATAAARVDEILAGRSDGLVVS